MFYLAEKRKRIRKKNKYITIMRIRVKYLKWGERFQCGTREYRVTKITDTRIFYRAINAGFTNSFGRNSMQFVILVNS